jgi:hypothetical protein
LAHQADPENRLLWRFNRRRLDWEELRDGLLATSGQLDRRLGGLPESAIAWPFSHRRTIYSFIDRALVPNDFRAFDFASPDAHVPQRYLTTVPQQALLLMNSPFVHEQARALAARVRDLRDVRARIEHLYQLVYGRRPTSDELSLGLQFVSGADSPSRAARDDWQYGQGEYDEKAGRVVSFTKLAYFINGQWRNSAMPGDPRDTTASIHARGGTPGGGKTQMPIKRWVATFDGRIKVRGTLSHNLENSCRKCEGMVGHAFSSRLGEQGKWTALQNSVATDVVEIAVQRGDAIDFVVTPGKGAGNNEFGWRIVIERLDASSERWDSERDFRAPSEITLSVWERYAHVLLMAAEFKTVE